MPEASLEMFTCPGCGRRYRWKTALAGRAVRCGCGREMVAPAQPPADDALYDLAPSVPPTVVVPPPAARPVLAYQPRAVVETSPYFPDKLKDLQIPVILLTAGVMVEFAAGWLGRGGVGPVQALARVGAELLIGTLLMLGAIFLAAKLRGLSFGPFWTAVLKLSAISVAPTAATTLLYAFFLRFIFLGGILSWVAGFCLYFALLGMLFDLDQSDTWYCVMVIFLVQLAVVFGALLLAMAGWW